MLLTGCDLSAGGLTTRELAAAMGWLRGAIADGVIGQGDLEGIQWSLLPDGWRARLEIHLGHPLDGL
jgi:hypothetical protein